MTGDSRGPRTAAVLVPMPAERPYTYAVPEDMMVVPGSIVRVPLGPREVAGVVWDGPGDAVEPRKLRPIAQVFDCPPLDNAARRFVDWIAAYTLSPPGMVARMFLRAPEAFDPEPWTEGLKYTGVAPDRMTAARQRVLELVAAPAHEPGARDQLELRAGGDERAGLVHPLAVDQHVAREDEPGRLFSRLEEAPLDEGDVEPDLRLRSALRPRPSRHRPRLGARRGGGLAPDGWLRQATLLGKPLHASSFLRPARRPRHSVARAPDFGYGPSQACAALSIRMRSARVRNA